MKIYSIIIAILLCKVISAQDIPDNYLAYTSHEDKVGYINLNGEEVIPVKFDRIQSFSEGLVAVNIGAKEVDYIKEGGKWGYYNLAGEEVIQIQYEDAKGFHEGLAPVKLKGKYGFIDTVGNVLIPFIYDDANSFSEGLAAVLINEKWGFINTKGEVAIEPTYDFVNEFDNGFSIVYHEQAYYEYEDDGFTFPESEGKYGVIDKTGTLVLDTIYDNIHDFKNGFARIELEHKQGSIKHGFINEKGEIAIPIIYDNAKDFSEGYAAVGKYIVRDSYHDFPYTKEQVDSLGLVVDNLIKAFSSENVDSLLNHPTFQEWSFVKMFEPQEHLMYGYINEAGEQKIDFLFDGAEDFKNDLAKIRFGVDVGISAVFTDLDGNVIEPPNNKNKLGANLIDKAGTFVFEKQHDQIRRYGDSILISYPFVGSNAKIETQQGTFESKYQSVSYLGNGYFIGYEWKAEDTDKVVFNMKNEIVLTFETKDVKYSGYGRFVVSEKKTEKNKRLKDGIVDMNGNWIIQPTYEYISDFELIQN